MAVIAVAVAAATLLAAAPASALGAALGGALGADEGAVGGAVYSLSADAVAALYLAADGPDPSSASSAAIWSLQANFLHRIESPGWGFTLSHNLDLSGQATGSQAFSPSVSIYEAYARLDLGDWGQCFVGKRRMGLGIGSTFAPGDLVDPRTGFWDQKNGFRGLDFAASVGSELSIRAAMSLDRNFDAYTAGLKSKSAAAGGPTAAAAATAAKAAYDAALDGASGPADPRLLVWALSTEAQLGSLQVALAGVYAPGDADAVKRPSLGLSYDLGGLIVQAEGAADFALAADDPDWYGTGGLRYTFSGDSDSLIVSADYAYNGRAGLLPHTHYLLPSVSYTRIDSFAVYARALVELEAPSALLSTGLTLYPVQGFDIELTGTFLLGAGGGEFAAMSALPSPGSETITDVIGLAARVHF